MLLGWQQPHRPAQQQQRPFFSWLFGGSKEEEAPEEPASLWTRMGEEAVIRPMCNDLYDRHASDPITAEWFPSASSWNIRTADEVPPPAPSFMFVSSLSTFQPG
jgi:hypothetical protein